MTTHQVPEFTDINAIAAVCIAFIFIILMSLLKEPVRQKYSAIIIGGAGAAYLSSGLGGWEFAFCSLMSIIAYKGLSKYYFIGIGWLLHSCWDVLHHLYADPIIPMNPSSSAGCAVCDAILAIWYFLNAPSVFKYVQSKRKHLVNAG